MISTSLNVELCSYNTSENISDYTFFDLVKNILISKSDFLIFFTSFIPLSVLGVGSFCIFVWNIYVFKFLVQFIQNINQKFRAVCLNILRVELLQVFVKNHWSVEWFSCVFFIINISLLQFKLDIRIKELAELSVLEKKILLLKSMILIAAWTYMLCNSWDHIEKCGTGNERLEANIHVTVYLITVYEAFIYLVKMGHWEIYVLSKFQGDVWVSYHFVIEIVFFLLSYVHNFCFFLWFWFVICFFPEVFKVV